MKKSLITILLITSTLISTAQSTIKTYIDQNLSNQGTKGITGSKLRGVLNATVDWVDSSKFSTTEQIEIERNLKTIYTEISVANTFSTPYVLNKKFEVIRVTASGPFYFAIDTIAKPIDVLMYYENGNFNNLIGRGSPIGNIFSQEPMPNSTFRLNFLIDDESKTYTTYREYFGYHLSLVKDSPVTYRQSFKLNFRGLFDNFAPLRRSLSTIGNSTGTTTTSLEAISTVDAFLIGPSNAPNVAQTITISSLNTFLNFRFITQSTTATHTIILPSTPIGWTSNTVYVVPYNATTITTPVGQTFKGTFTVRRINSTTQNCIVFP
jgi:hypothetical protein